MKQYTEREIIEINEKVMDGWFRYCSKNNSTHPFTTAICFEMGDDCTPETECPLAALCGGKDAEAKEALAKELITTGKFLLG